MSTVNAKKKESEKQICANCTRNNKKTKIEFICMKN